MSRIRILGAGACGLPLAHRLLHGGAEVTLVTDHRAETVLSGHPTSTQVGFPPTIDLENTAGQDFWRTTAPQITGIRFSVVTDRTPTIHWAGRFTRPTRSVDQRTILTRWLHTYLAAGGTLDIADPDLADIDHNAPDYDLTIATRARADLAACFAPDPTRPPTGPIRHLSVLYLDGVTPDPEDMGSYIALPGIGEIISHPGLTGHPGDERRCEMLLFEARPHSPLDVFPHYSSSVQRLDLARELLREHLPAHLADRYHTAELTDAGATLVSAITPTARRPIGTLPSGIPVLGAGEAIGRTEPAGAPGPDSAAHYARAILRHTRGPLDREWMTATAAPWLTETAHPATRWTANVTEPPAPVRQLMLAAAHHPAVATAFADTFAQPIGLAALPAGA